MANEAVGIEDDARRALRDLEKYVEERDGNENGM